MKMNTDPCPCVSNNSKGPLFKVINLSMLMMITGTVMMLQTLQPDTSRKATNRKYKKSL